MAYDYNKAKQAWESMNDQQKKQYTEQNKNDANFQQFAQQYHNENYSTGNSNSDVNQGQGTNTPPSNTGGSNFNNDNGSNGGFSNNNNNNNNNNYGNQGGSPLSDGKNGNGNFYGNTQFDQEEQLDKSMFQQGTGVKVEQGTAKDTGRPDYQLDSDARLAEMTNNLNTYWQTNPEYFSNRETFNKVFEYNQRESDAQRALLDSYWKKKKDMDTASNYNSGDSIYGGLNNAEITPDVFSLIKQMNPEAYQQYQKMLKDEQDKAIANLKFTGAEPLDVTLTNIINKLGIQPGDPHKIRQTFEDRLTELNVWQDSEQLRVLGNNIAGLMSAMNNNAQSLSSQLEGRYSAGYIDARINKANANLQRQANTMLTSYSTLLQGRQQNIALAYQSAQVEQMQAQEDERIFNDKIKALGFAMEYNSYRTPEQKLALQLEEQQIKNNMELLQKSQENDLALYNKYATAKLENQLNSELTDLSVTDPTQLRANLNNVLDEYYTQYGDIIQRPKSQVIDDVLAYAKAEGISVAEALKKNFIEPLMSKPEYQQAVRDAYGMTPKTEFQKIGDTLVCITINPDGTYQIKNLGYYGDNVVGSTGSLSQGTRTERNNNPTAMTTDVAKSLGLVEGTDYVVGDKFPGDSNLYTAKLLGDPIETTIKALDNGANSSSTHAFYTAGGKQRWTHTAMSDADWLKLSKEEKENVVRQMLQREGGSMDNMAYYKGQVSSYNPMLEEFFKGNPAEFTSTQWNTIKEMGYSPSDFGVLRDNFLKEAAKTPDATTVKILDTLGSLVVNYPGEWNLKSTMIGGDVIDSKLGNYISDYDFIKNNLTMDNLIRLKGQGATFGSLTEGEWPKIETSASKLSKKMDETAFKTELLNIYNTYAEKAGMGTLTLEDLTKMYGGTLSTKQGTLTVNLPNYVGDMATFDNNTTDWDAVIAAARGQ